MRKARDCRDCKNSGNLEFWAGDKTDKATIDADGNQECSDRKVSVFDYRLVAAVNIFSLECGADRVEFSQQ